MLRKIVLITMLFTLSSCHLEQGKLHFDEFDLDPITVYKMAPVEAAVFCIVERKNRPSKNLKKEYRDEIKKIEANIETENWGKLACLAMDENADLIQIAETIVMLKKIHKVRPRHGKGAIGFTEILQHKVKLLNTIEEHEAQIKRLQDRNEEKTAQFQIAQQKKQAEIDEKNQEIKSLEKKIENLKEVELLLHPKKR
ncbi:MAG: hypothetical protein D6B25_17905 [Desulfobulbaceae bacterium]|nr:MAG: hypothetical protein D6B25_17905 [Desulfobulbaceae bacterium]